MLRNRILGILHKYPLTYSSAKTGFVLWSADIFTQFIEIKNSQDEQKQDLHRNGRFALIGSILIGPLIHFRGKLWTKLLVPKSPMKSLAKFLPFDMLIFNPSTICCIVTSVCILQNQGIEHIKEKFKANFGPVISRLWTLEITLMIINCAILPMKHWHTFRQSIFLFWFMYISSRCNQSFVSIQKNDQT